MAMEGSRAAPFCRAPDGGRYLVDVTGPFLAKFGRVLSCSVSRAVAIMDMDEDGPVLIVAHGPPGGVDDTTSDWVADVLEGLASAIGATAWPGQTGDEVSVCELEAAAAEIVAELSFEDVEEQLPHVVADRGTMRRASGRKRTRRSGT